ncbi:transposase (plasmid) [Deinococcus radiomollis]|uniref:transposase n=1 Tax=Deinococcus radiomollis TaxID=468916 RepID=UPI003892911B
MNVLDKPYGAITIPIHYHFSMSWAVENERLSLVYLPPYAPELNPVELVWAYVKRHVLANLCPENVDALKTSLRSAWQKVRARNLPVKLLGITEELQT